jgi:hypothetical protein
MNPCKLKRVRVVLVPGILVKNERFASEIMPLVSLLNQGTIDDDVTSQTVTPYLTTTQGTPPIGSDAAHSISTYPEE